MARIISKCPGCAGMLHITTLRCPDCGMELKQDFALTQFDKLTDEEYLFLMTFLRQRGNLKNVQNDLEISYPTATTGRTRRGGIGYDRDFRVIR